MNYCGKDFIVFVVQAGVVAMGKRMHGNGVSTVNVFKNALWTAL